MRSTAELRRSRGQAVVGLSASLALVLFAGSAIGAKLTTKSESVAVPPDTLAAATPQCKPKQKVVSGGFESVDFDAEFNDAGHLPYASFRQDKRSWTAAAQGFGSQEGTLIAYAYCRKGKGLERRSASTTVPALGAGDTGTATVRCNEGEKVVAGGYDVPDLDPATNRAFTYASHKDGRRAWTVSAQSYDSQPATLTAYAYCREGKGVKAKSQTGSVGLPPETATVTAKCKRKQRVVSGGFDSPGFEYSVSDVLPFVSRKRGARRWTVSAYNEGSETGTLTVYAYCEKRK